MIAPGRALRPGAARGRLEPPTQVELADCPFCAGRENRTPPETLRVPSDGDWRVRVVPNKYPAFSRHEVVIHTPRHARSIAELEGAELREIAEAWRRRREDEPGGHLFAAVNEGREAGASLPHSHSQLVWLSGTPPAVAAERSLDQLLDGPRALEREGVVAVCPPASRAPYEVVIAPAEPGANAFSSPLLPAALELLGEVVRRLRSVAGPVSLNAWLHDGPRWHLELVPRLTVAAGLELGAGVYINPLAPEEAAQQLAQPPT